MSKYFFEKKQNPERADWFFIIYSVAVLIYLIAINTQKDSTLSIIAAIVVLPFLFRPEKFLPLVFACAINGEFFVAYEGISMARIYTVVFAAGTLIQIILKKRKVRWEDIVLYGFFAVFAFISAGTSYTGDITAAVSFILYLVMAFSLIYTPFDRKFFLLSCSLISFILSVYYIVVLASGAGDSFLGRASVSDATNPNPLGMGIAQLVGFNFAGYFVAEKKLAKLLFVASAACNITSILFTGSRSALIGAFGGVVACLILITFGKSPEIRRINPLAAALFVVGCVIAYFVVLEIDPEVMKRFTVDNIKESGGTGRVDIWMVTMKKVFPKFPMFGLGFGGANLSLYLLANYGIRHGAHNIFVAMISEMGIAGILIFIPYLIACYIKIIKTYRFDCSSLIPFTMLTTIIFNGVGENTFGTRILWFAVGLCLMISRQKRENLLPKTRALDVVRTGRKNEKG